MTFWFEGVACTSFLHLRPLKTPPPPLLSQVCYAVQTLKKPDLGFGGYLASSGEGNEKLLLKVASEL